MAPEPPGPGLLVPPVGSASRLSRCRRSMNKPPATMAAQGCGWQVVVGTSQFCQQTKGFTDTGASREGLQPASLRVTHKRMACLSADPTVCSAIPLAFLADPPHPTPYHPPSAAAMPPTTAPAIRPVELDLLCEAGPPLSVVLLSGGGGGGGWGGKKLGDWGGSGGEWRRRFGAGGGGDGCGGGGDGGGGRGSGGGGEGSGGGGEGLRGGGEGSGGGGEGSRGGGDRSGDNGEGGGGEESSGIGGGGERASGGGDTAGEGGGE